MIYFRDIRLFPYFLKTLYISVCNKFIHLCNCYFLLYRLEVKVKGKPKPKGKWYKQGTEIVSSQEFQIEEFEDGTSVLTIAETFPDDTGEITFEAYNPLGVSTTTAYLSVEGNIFLCIQDSKAFTNLVKLNSFQLHSSIGEASSKYYSILIKILLSYIPLYQSYQTLTHP